MQNKKWNIGWGITSKCNMNCDFCYSKFKRREKNDLQYSDWVKFIDENAKYINSINYGTGENSLSEDWFLFIDYVRKTYPNIKQAVTTNGYIAEIAEHNENKMRIFETAIDEVDVSLDFGNLKKHSEFRGQPKAGEWVIKTLKLCNALKKHTTIVTLASKVNFNERNIDEIFKVAKNYKVMVRVNLYRPTEGISTFSKQFILDPDVLIDRLYYIAKKYKVLLISDMLLSAILTNKEEKDPCGINSLRILPDGNISPSTYLIKENFIISNIREDEVLKKIEDNIFLKEVIKDVIPEECKSCKYMYKCRGGVYDRRYLWNGSLKQKDPYCIYTPGEKEMKKIQLSNENFTSVHQGYLPTMFFRP